MSDSSKKIAPEMIEDIFGIPVVPRNGKNISEDSDEDDLGFSNEPTNLTFDVKAKEVAEVVSNPPSQKQTEKTKESKIINTNNNTEKAMVNTVPATVQNVPSTVSEKKAPAATPSPKSTLTNDLFEDDDVQPTKTSPVPKKNAVVEQETPKLVPVTIKVDVKPSTVNNKILPDDPNEEELANDDTRSADSGPCVQWTGGEQWLIDSPAPKYDRLYREKKIALTDGPNCILKGGQLDFDKLFDELAELNVDVTVKTYNPQDIHNKMQQVQQIRARLEHIRLKVSRQYHHWERYIELFHGVLCRTEYERGKQEGLNYDHLRDMEHYFCSLKALYKASEGVMRTLDGAFECLSRQVTVVMPMKEIDRYGSGTQTAPSTTPKPMTPSLKKYDALNSNTEPKSGEGELPDAWKI